MPTYRLTLSYRGTAYAGWQRQENALAVQQVVEEALERLLGEAVRIAGASRTDAGVHARGQVAHLELARPFPERGLVHGVNRFLPADVRVLAAAAMPAGFHARRHAAAKEYVYRLSGAPVISPLDALFVAPAPAGLDAERMARAAGALPGRHDFSAFALAGGSHGQPFRRIVSARWEEREGGELALPGGGRGVPARHGSCFGGDPDRGRHGPADARELRRPARRPRLAGRRARRLPRTVSCYSRSGIPRNGAWKAMPTRRL